MFLFDYDRIDLSDLPDYIDETELSGDLDVSEDYDDKSIQRIIESMTYLSDEQRDELRSSLLDPSTSSLSIINNVSTNFFPQFSCRHFSYLDFSVFVIVVGKECNLYVQ